jgi:hypothetical protein
MSKCNQTYPKNQWGNFYNPANNENISKPMLQNPGADQTSKGEGQVVEIRKQG